MHLTFETFDYFKGTANLLLHLEQLNCCQVVI